MPLLGSTWTNECAAGYYRVRAVLTLVAANVACLLIAFLGPQIRIGRGEASSRDKLAIVLTVLVCLIFPSIPVFALYWTRWPSLRAERIHGWQGRCMTWTLWVLCIVAICSLMYVVVFSPCETPSPPPGYPLENYRPPEMSLESQVLNWYTAVSLLLVLASVFGLVPVDPYKGKGTEASEASDRSAPDANRT